MATHYVMQDPDYEKNNSTENRPPENIRWWVTPIWIFIGAITIFNCFYYAQYNDKRVDGIAILVMLIEVVIYTLFTLWYNKTRIKSKAKEQKMVLWFCLLVVAGTLQGFVIYTATSTTDSVSHYASISEIDPNNGEKFLTLDKYELFDAPLHSITVSNGKTNHGRQKYKLVYLVPMGIDSTVLCWFVDNNDPTGIDGIYGPKSAVIRKAIVAFSVQPIAEKINYPTSQQGYDSLELLPMIEPAFGKYSLEPMFDTPPSTSFWTLITGGVFVLFVIISRWIAKGLRYTNKCILVSQEQYNAEDSPQEEEDPEYSDEAIEKYLAELEENEKSKK